MAGLSLILVHTKSWAAVVGGLQYVKNRRLTANEIKIKYSAFCHFGIVAYLE